MAEDEVMRCNRICCMNDPDKGCLLGGVEECRIGSEQVMRRDEVMHRAEHYASSYSREYIVALIQEAVGETTDYWAGLVADALITQGVIPTPRKEANPRDLSGYADKLREIKEEKAKKSVEKALEKAEKAGLI